MQFFRLLSVAALAAAVSAETTTGKLGDAAVIDNNPADKTYEAVFSGKVTGSVKFATGAGGKGVEVTVDVTGFANEPGPFGYHIHDQPVPADGNCTGTLAHLDPYERGQTVECDSADPATCQVGDLSGKHGAIKIENATSAEHFSASYTDDYISAVKGQGSFFGNRSVVIHRADAEKTRLVCANITMVASSNGTSNGTGNGTGSTGTPPVATGAAGANAVSSVLAAVGVVAGLMAVL